MTNIQGFFIPNINLLADENISFPDISSNFNIMHVKWENLLGKNNKEVIISSLINSPKFNIFVQDTKEDFKSNYTNLRRFPKINESNWE